MEIKRSKHTHREKADIDYLVKRLNIIEGQIRGIKQMVMDERYCNDILIQVAAVEKSLKTLGNHILENHMNTCVVRDIKEGNEDIIDEVMELVKKLQ